MPKLVVRHALSEANNRENIGTLAFGARDACLMEKGVRAAKERGVTFARDFGKHPEATPVAVSTLRRTGQTALAMGFRRLTAFGMLDEVVPDMEGPALRVMLDKGTVPSAALRAAEAILRRPPEQEVWVTHGLVIAGLSEVLGVSHQFERLVPRFCEVRSQPI